jgi:hypothetical protein
MRERLKGRRRKAVLQEKGGANILEGAGLQDLIVQTGLKDCRLISDMEQEGGTWIEMKKTSINY